MSGNQRPIPIQMLAASAQQGPGESADQLLATALPSQIGGFGDLIRLVQPAIRQGNFGLFDAEEKHGNSGSGHWK
jgi:hypothetical protein